MRRTCGRGLGSGGVVWWGSGSCGGGESGDGGGSGEVNGEESGEVSGMESGSYGERNDHSVYLEIGHVCSDCPECSLHFETGICAQGSGGGCGGADRWSDAGCLCPFS